MIPLQIIYGNLDYEENKPRSTFLISFFAAMQIGLVQESRINSLHLQFLKIDKQNAWKIKFK